MFQPKVLLDPYKPRCGSLTDFHWVSGYLKTKLQTKKFWEDINANIPIFSHKENKYKLDPLTGSAGDYFISWHQEQEGDEKHFRWYPEHVGISISLNPTLRQKDGFLSQQSMDEFPKVGSTRNFQQSFPVKTV